MLHIFSAFLEKYATENRQDIFYCNLLTISDRLMPTDFHYLPSRLNQPRTKHYCKKISKKLFPDYYDRRTTERTFSNMYIYSDFSIDDDFPDNRKVQSETESKRVDYLKYN
ncbi:hypothetical protein T08_4373 [Trichinella sp. T8]|nr:hypothetical protein T08_4373 [Trichinella sp. T8]